MLISNCCQAKVNEDQCICLDCKEHCQVLDTDNVCERCGLETDYHSRATKFYYKETGNIFCDNCLDKLDADVSKGD